MLDWGRGTGKKIDVSKITSFMILYNERYHYFMYMYDYNSAAIIFDKTINSFRTSY